MSRRFRLEGEGFLSSMSWMFALTCEYYRQQGSAAVWFWHRVDESLGVHSSFPEAMQ